MSELWRQLTEDIHALDHSQADQLDLQLTSCLLAMTRYLVEADRARRGRDAQHLSSDSGSTGYESAAAGNGKSINDQT